MRAGPYICVAETIGSPRQLERPSASWPIAQQTYVAGGSPAEARSATAASSSPCVGGPSLPRLYVNEMRSRLMGRPSKKLCTVAWQASGPAAAGSAAGGAAPLNPAVVPPAAAPAANRRRLRLLAHPAPNSAQVLPLRVSRTAAARVANRAGLSMEAAPIACDLTRLKLLRLQYWGSSLKGAKVA